MEKAQEDEDCGFLTIFLFLQFPQTKRIDKGFLARSAKDSAEDPAPDKELKRMKELLGDEIEEVPRREDRSLQSVQKVEEIQGKLLPRWRIRHRPTQIEQ